MAYIGKPEKVVEVDEPIEAPVWTMPNPQVQPQPELVPMEPIRMPELVPVRQTPGGQGGQGGGR